MLKMEIHLELNVPSNGLDVNQVIVLFQQIQEQIGPALAECYLETIQAQLLDQVLGPKWANAPQQEAPWACPECGSRQGFKRRGSYPRVLRKSSLGRVEFNLCQVTCCSCEHTFSPFPDLLGLEPYQVSTTEFQAKAVDVACQTSYARAVEHIRNLAHVQISATAVHRWVQGQGTEVTLDEMQADQHTVLLDSTKVCAGDKERGCSLNLALSVRKRYWTNGRPRMDIHPVCFGVDEGWSETGQALEETNPDRLVFDGDEGLGNWVTKTFTDSHKQRGTWHLVRQLYWPLWKDGLGKAQATRWIEKLRNIVYHPAGDVKQSQRALQTLIHQLAEAGLHRAAEYLASAAPYAFTYREHPDGLFFDDRRFESLAISSTSPAERQMREINRRTDVGARWSVPGVTNLIGLDLVRRFDREQWRALWQLPEQAVHESSVVNLQVSAKAEP